MKPVSDRAAGGDARLLKVQHFGFRRRDIQSLRDILRAIGQGLSVSFDLCEGGGGDLTLMGSEFALTAPRGVLVPLFSACPVVVLETRNGDLLEDVGTFAITGRRKSDLGHQLMALPLVRRRALQRGSR